MSNKKIITIGRQIGCNGRLVGELLSQRMGIPVYDKQALKAFAKEKGVCEEIFNRFDEKPPTNSLLYSLVMDPYSFGFNFDASYVPINQKVFAASSDIIKELAASGSSIFMGRCADYILSEQEECFNIFLYAPLEFRVKNIMEEKNMKENEARSFVASKDKQRATYYNYYTNKKWGAMKSYNICIDVSKMSIEDLVKFIEFYVNI